MNKSLPVPPSTDAPPVPHTPADLPGLGPIRIRALHKAGLDSLPKLRRASLETLTSVPGITAIKAQYLFDYLAQFPVDALKDRPVVKPEPGAEAPVSRGGRRTEASPLLEQFHSTASVPVTSPLASESARTLSKVIALLVSDHAVGFRNRLLREISRFAQQAENLAVENCLLSSKDQERALRRLRRISDDLVRSTAQPEFDRKEQARVADGLAEVTDWLMAQTEAAGKASTKGGANV